MNNTLKLLSLTIVTFLISGYLFYQGLKPELDKRNLVPEILQQSPTPAPSTNVLGNTTTSSIDNEVLVLNVTDGDTIEVEYQGKKRKLRYIGINTPETVDPRKPVECFGKQASEENKRLLEGGKVLLEKDVSDTDKFDRLLRYVYLSLGDGTKLFVNDYLVRGGYAYAYTYPPDVKYSGRFFQAQKEARENLRGLWASCSK